MFNQNKQTGSPQYCCAFHPGIESKWACQNCKTLFCDACVIHKSVGKFKAHVCPRTECRGRCVPVKVDEFSGKIEEIEPVKGKKTATGKIDVSPARRYLTRYYLSLFFPAFALVAYDILLFLDGRKPLLWLVVAWGLLIFLMSGRYFWAYVAVTITSFIHAVYSFYRIYSFETFKDSNSLVNWLSLGLWLFSLLILACSHSEFTE